MPQVLLILAALGWLAPAAARADPMNSPACLSALQALTQAERSATAAPQPSSAAGAAGAGAAAPGLRTARRATAEACLGTADDAPPAVRHQAPLAVDRLLRPDSPGAALPPPAPSRAPMPPAVLTPPLHMTTVCNADGCWTTEGLRLQRQGPVLQGPRGPCLQIGGVLSCP